MVNLNINFITKILRFQRIVILGTFSVPIISIYNHLVVYFFLPIPKKKIAMALGGTTSLICITLFVMDTLLVEDDFDIDNFIKQLVADMVFYFGLNFIGLYMRYIGEINLRRGFLDKRESIDTTYR